MDRTADGSQLAEGLVRDDDASDAAARFRGGAQARLQMLRDHLMQHGGVRSRAADTAGVHTPSAYAVAGVTGSR